MKIKLSNIYPSIITISLMKGFDKSVETSFKRGEYMEIIMHLAVLYFFNLISILKTLISRLQINTNIVV